MTGQTCIRWSGAAAVLGGALWVAGAVLTARQPEGCIGAACDLPGRSMRPGAAADAALFVAGLLFIGLGAAAVALRAWRAGRFGPLGRVGLVASCAGAGLLLGAGLVQAVFFGGDFPAMPVVVIPAVLALVVGVVLLGVVVLRAGVLPRWAAALVILGALALLGANDQNAQVQLAIPFGIAWVVVGCVLWSGQGEQPAQPVQD